MNSDLQYIKKKYGEKMMHFCRDNFSTILEKEGVLTQIFNDYFGESRSLYEDLKNSNWLFQFKNFITRKASGKIDEINGNLTETNKTPEELFGSADAIPWTNLSEYLQEQFGTNQTFYIRKNALRNNDALYIGKAKTAEFATEQSVNVMPMSLTQPEAPSSTKFTLWYKGDCTKIPIKES